MTDPYSPSNREFVGGILRNEYTHLTCVTQEEIVSVTWASFIWRGHQDDDKICARCGLPLRDTPQ